MSTNKYAGGLSALLAEKAREKARAEKTPESTSDSQAPSAHQSPVKPPRTSDSQAPSDYQTPGDSQAPSDYQARSDSVTSKVVTESLRANQSPRASQSPGDYQSPPSARLSVAPVAGYLQISNTVIDGILGRLNPYEQSVYLRLYRLSQGHRRDTCTVSYETLAQRTCMSRRHVIRAVEKLESLGLIQRLPTSGRERSAGNLYRIPEVPIAKQGASDSQSPGDLQAPSDYLAHMKEDMKRKDRKAPVAVAPAPDFSIYDIRRIAARFRELHHGESDYTKEQLGADVRTALIGEGREVDDRMIDEAIG
jgi:hypothetical protein